MAPQKHLAVSANTNRVLSPKHRGICTALRCEANTSAFLSKGKHPFPPSLRHKETVSDKDADTSLGRALQNDRATRPCVAERHTAVRPAWWSLTPVAAGEFAAVKISLNRPIASAKAKARLHTRGAPEPATSLCAKSNARIHTPGVPGPGSSSLSKSCPTLSWVSATLVHTSEFLPGEMGKAPLRSTLLYRPRSHSGRSRQELKENKSQGP
jgi:hypothetical protein